MLGYDFTHSGTYVIHGQDDKQLGPALEQLLTEGVAFALKLGRIARRGGVAHVREFLGILDRHRLQVSRGYWAVQDQVTAVQLDLSR